MKLVVVLYGWWYAPSAVVGVEVVEILRRREVAVLVLERAGGVVLARSTA